MYRIKLNGESIVEIRETKDFKDPQVAIATMEIAIVTSKAIRGPVDLCEEGGVRLFTALPKRLFAFVNEQGTAAGETALCEDCKEDKKNIKTALGQANLDVDIGKGLVDCSLNDAICCITCGFGEERRDKYFGE